MTDYDHSIVRCNTCGWEGQACDCRHGQDEDENTILLCPTCCSNNVQPLPEEDGGKHSMVERPHYPTSTPGGKKESIPV